MPATMATIVPASKACRIKSYCHMACKSVIKFQLNLSAMGVSRLLGAQYRDPAARIMDNFYRRIVKPAKSFRGDYFFRRASGYPPASHVNHTVHNRQQRVDIVGY